MRELKRSDGGRVGKRMFPLTSIRTDMMHGRGEFTVLTWFSEGTTDTMTYHDTLEEAEVEFARRLLLYHG